ncbi:uncharacterized protein LOC141802570 [Halichoeres trimaculatus]|uniref:uncharacterized protein LOC141802570 n=1 Tax=Halichoeres trimaculatus TaxID=147232 RepID=UPI003D9F99DA
MQPIEAAKGCPLKSQLLDSLMVYLNNKRRLQPIIGLGRIIECVKKGTQDTETLYLCEVCVCRLSRADIRTHIMGSLHRYNYIKVLHPDLVPEWKENCDLSKLAWPLMEIAKTLEEKEGPGEVQLIELEDCVFQTLAAFSESEAIALISIIRTRQVWTQPVSCFKEPPVQPEQTQPHRTVLFNPDQQRWCDTSTQMFPEAFVPSESSFLDNHTGTFVPPESSCVTNHTETYVPSESSFLDNYTGMHPLIGLSRVIECRDEDGHTYCFLCHCCRIRTNKNNIIDHLTSPSHLVNYLGETCPEQMEVLTADNSDDYQLLQSAAERVEQEEGIERLKVVKAPESLCVKLTSRSYHWCVKMLYAEWPQTDILKTNLSVKGFSVNTEMPETGARVMTVCRERPMRKMKKKRDTVFRVSVPLTQGPLLLKRMSFSEDTIPLEAGEYASQSGSDPIQIPSGPKEDELDLDTTLRSEKNLTVKIFQEGTSDLSDNDQGGNFTEKDEKNSDSDNGNGQHPPQDISSEMLNTEWLDQVPQAQDEWMLPPGCHTQDGAPDFTSYGQMYWYKPTSQATVDTNVPIENTQWETVSDPALSYSEYYSYYDYYNYFNYPYQQQAHNQYIAQSSSGLQTAVQSGMDCLAGQMLT